MFSNYTVGTVVSQQDHCDHKHTCVTPGFAQTDDYGNIVRFQWTPDARFNFEVTSDSWIPVPEGSIALTQSGQLPDDIATVCDTFAYNTVDYRCWKNDCGNWLEQPEISIDPQSRTRLLFSDKSKSTRVVIKNFREEVVQTFESSGNTVSIVVDDTLAEQLLQGYYNMDVYLVGTSMIRHIRRITVSIGNYVDDSVQCDPDCHEPVPVIPNPSLENEQKDAWELNRAFISVNSIEERDSLNIDSLPHGKIVRVADTTDGVKYYSWDQVTFTWKEETFPIDNSTKVEIEVDDHLSETSTNPVQNKVIYEALKNASSTAVVADWNQDDPSQPDYVKNRTHWYTRKLVYEGLSTFSPSGQSHIGHPYYLQIPATQGDENFSGGILVMDGVNYEFSRGSYDSQGSVQNAFSIGSVSLFVTFSESGPPFDPICQFIIYSSEDISGFDMSLYIDDLQTLDEKYVPDTIARVNQLPPTPVQSDWNQNSPDGLDHVKNRTHWCGKEFVTPIYEGTLSFNEMSSPVIGTGGNNYAAYLSEAFVGLEGTPSTLSVTIDGVDYECPVGPRQSLSAGTLYSYKVEVSSNEYIALSVAPYSATALTVACTAGLINSQYCIKALGDVYHPLDDRYIPSTIARVSDVSTVIISEEDVTELLNKLNKYSEGE